MTTNRSFIRTAGITLTAAAAIALYTGCSKKAETTEAQAPAETAPAVAPEAATVSSIPAPEQFTPPASAQAVDPGTALVLVNGEPITLGELEEEMNSAMARMQGRVPPERLAQMRMQMRDRLLDNMITRKVLVDQIKAESIEVTDEELEEGINEYSKSLPPGTTINDMLAQTQATEEEFRTALRSELEIRKLIESHVGEAVPPTDEELQAFYDENKDQFERPETVSASHILISVEPGDSEEDKAAKRKELEDIRAQLLEGGDFAALATEHSSCPSSAQGGDLGSFPRGAMVPEFEEAAFTQEIDAVGDIVETQFGYHLIKVAERNEAGMTPLEEVKEQLGDYLAGQKQQQEVQEYVASLRESADVTYPGEEETAN